TKTFNLVVGVTSMIEGETIGYCRNNLIVMGSIEVVNSEVARLFAHELAHYWCHGADSSTWEDWLNETFAEHSALLLIEDKYGEEAYNNRIRYHNEEADAAPAIRTPDGRRPHGVHSKGTVMIQNLRKLYGRDKVFELIRIFEVLNPKTTDQFVAEVRIKLGDEISNYIIKHIT
ncbi:hypothetical protein, partial [Paenibacillus apii]|uniref:hypothetical protein n=1 Tax=Paenibacillus apii TaxID=1850370 RepID=UPI00197F77E0